MIRIAVVSIFMLSTSVIAGGTAKMSAVESSGGSSAMVSLLETDHSSEISIKSVELKNSMLTLTVDPSVGGRVGTLHYGNRQLLFSQQDAVDSNNWGSTFWLSPQSLWGWPPIEAHDSAPYKVSALRENSIEMISDWGEGVQVQKRLDFDDARDNLLRLNYTLEVDRDFTELAGWEITRVPRRGVVFYPAKEQTLAVAMGAVAFQHRQDVVWMELKPDVKPPEGKLNANGDEGWLAWIEDELLYLKLYKPVPEKSIATNEGDVEIYFSPREDYVELEVQSAAKAFHKGERMEWQVSWLIEPVPTGMDVSEVNPSLLKWVRGLAASVPR